MIEYLKYANSNNIYNAIIDVNPKYDYQLD